MIPTKVLQLDYQDLGDLVQNHISKIVEHEKSNNLKFDAILSNYENSTFVGSILSKYLNIPNISYIFVNDKVSFFPTTPNIYKNILFVEILCVDKMFSEHKQELENQFKEAKICSYAPLVSKKLISIPNITGLVSEDYFMTPWLWNSFTPQSHLDRISNNDIKEFDKDSIHFGFSSENCFKSLEDIIEKPISKEWINIISIDKLQSTSQIGTMEDLNNKSFNDYHQKYHKYIEEKSSIIKENGVTHFFEENINQIFLLSESCPTVHFYYISNGYVYKLKASKILKQDIFNLNF